MGFTTAAAIQEQRESVIQITTGCKELDSILEGTSTDNSKALWIPQSQFCLGWLPCTMTKIKTLHNDIFVK
jgi:hypothetical protein